MICRRNDARVDVDNGTRGTIRAVDAQRVVLETDAGTVRELPASYVAEHVEYAYALTGHGMQGSTVQWAGVVGTPEHMTQGWSYTALSRARETTKLYVSDEGPERDPEQEQEGPALLEERDHESTLWRVRMRMMTRDDEDLAVEQLPDPFVGAGRPGDRDVAGAPDPGTPIQERGAEPQPARPPGGAQRELVEFHAQQERLELQRQALPARELERLDAIAEEHAQLLARRREHAERLGQTPPPPRYGRDEHARERGYLQSLVDSHDQRLAAMHGQHNALRNQVAATTGRDAKAVRNELRGNLEQSHQIAEEQRRLRSELQREAVNQPPAWVRDTLGERPHDGHRASGEPRVVGRARSQRS